MRKLGPRALGRRQYSRVDCAEAEAGTALKVGVLAARVYTALEQEG